METCNPTSLPMAGTMAPRFLLPGVHTLYMYNAFPVNVGGPDLIRKKSTGQWQEVSEIQSCGRCSPVDLEGANCHFVETPYGRKWQVASRGWPLADDQHERGDLNCTTTRNWFLPITTWACKRAPGSRRKDNLADTLISTCETLRRESSHATPDFQPTETVRQ